MFILIVEFVIAALMSPSKRTATPKVGVAHIMKIVNRTYGSVAQTGQQHTFPLQQKLAVCTLLLMLRTGKTKEIAVGKVNTIIHVVTDV